MGGVWTIARRELASLFVTPVGWLVLAAFSVFSTFQVVMGLSPGTEATMRAQFEWVVYLLVFFAPAISMRLLSEEIRGQTLELLGTAPISDAQVIVGKWLGSVGFLAALLLPLMADIAVLEMVAAPDYGPIVSGLVGLLFVGALYMAVGLCVSATTDSQLTAYLVTVLLIALMTFGLFYLAGWQTLPPWLGRTAAYLNVNGQYADFAKGLIDLRNFVYFITLTALMLFVATKLLESRRWR